MLRCGLVQKHVHTAMENSSFTLILGGQSLPIDFHGLGLVEEEMREGLPCGAFSFHFSWRQYKFRGDYREAGGGAALTLQSDLCPMPFSAESPQARIDLEAVVRAANKALGAVLRVERGHIALHHPLEIPLPLTAVGLITPLTAFLIRLSPYLDCLGLVMAPPLSQPRGVSLLRPAYRRSRQRA
ncbi:hypothetical protein GALL_116060 [mine drainage metagenome]|uniref:Uncharacterized protein n=1 Tax=mine drainage metagenome TaxID=410659 RepID=A0A1J5T1S4_9ZZZZ